MSHYKGPDVEVTFPNFRPTTSVLKLLVEALHNNGHATALVEGQTGKIASYADVLQLSTSLCAGLRKAGVTFGDVVVMCCDQGILPVSLLLGIMFTGASAVLVPVSYASTIHELTRRSTVKAVFSGPAYKDCVAKSVLNMSPAPALVASIDLEDPIIASFITCAEAFTLCEVPDAKKHVPLILFSSGTTGVPKGVMLTDIALQLFTLYFNHGLKSMMAASPIFWLSGIVTVNSCIINKYTLVMSNSKDPKVNLALIQKHKIETWFSNTGGLSMYINESSLHEFDISSLKEVLVGGETVLSHVAMEFISKVLKDKTVLRSLYGSTEVGLLTPGAPASHEDTFISGLCGYLHPGVEVKVVDDDGNVVAPGVVGELRVKSLAMFAGYWNRPEAKSQLMDSDGFFDIGDAGRFDDKGRLFIKGRVCDLINFKGIKISPAELEDILMSHPAVVEAAIVGKPHPTDIEHMTAYVVRKPGSEVTTNEIAAFYDSQVVDVNRLRGGVHFLNALPRVIIGKVLRRQLKEM